MTTSFPMYGSPFEVTTAAKLEWLGRRRRGSGSSDQHLLGFVAGSLARGELSATLAPNATNCWCYDGYDSANEAPLRSTVGASAAYALTNNRTLKDENMFYEADPIQTR